MILREALNYFINNTLNLAMITFALLNSSLKSFHSFNHLLYELIPLAIFILNLISKSFNLLFVFFCNQLVLLCFLLQLDVFVLLIINLRLYIDSLLNRLFHIVNSLPLGINLISCFIKLFLYFKKLELAQSVISVWGS